MLTGPEAAAYSTSDALAASAATSRRIEDAKDARQFAENYPYAGFSAA
jgi:hypothetical protein